jgi:transcriptional regulator of acetoin/glycerol metabolism
VELGADAPPTLEFDFVERLATHDWPLNVRELVLLVRRLRVFCGDEPSLRARHLPDRIGEQVEQPAPRPRVATKSEAGASDLATPERVELPELVAALRASQGNVAKASVLLGITRQRAYRLIEGHALDLENLRK